MCSRSWLLVVCDPDKMVTDFHFFRTTKKNDLIHFLIFICYKYTTFGFPHLESSSTFLFIFVFTNTILFLKK